MHTNRDEGQAKRFVVMDDVTMGRPVYVAVDEADAARWLDAREAVLRKEGMTIERHNSLTLSVTAPNRYKTYRVYSTPSGI
jgi:hypothetical protein